MTPSESAGLTGIEIPWSTVLQKIDRIDSTVTEIKAQLDNYEYRISENEKDIDDLGESTRLTIRDLKAEVEDLKKKVWSFSGLAGILSGAIAAIVTKGL